MHRYDAYDPWEHTHQLGFRFERAPLSHPDHLAECHVDRRLILLKPGLTWRVERCELSHENVHAEYGDLPIPEGIELRKRELRCDRIAADRLVNPERLARAMIEHPDPATWCLDLDITARVLRTYLHHHPEIRDEARRLTQLRRAHTPEPGVMV